VFDHANKEAHMRRFAHLALLTGIFLAVAAILPLVALAGGGDPTGI
jgi:hypothetical protein